MGYVSANKSPSATPFTTAAAAKQTQTQSAGRKPAVTPAGRGDEARAAYARALELTQPGAEQSFLQQQISQCG